MVDFNELDAAIRAARGILLCTHCNPDGDGIGSQLALYEALHDAGFPVRMHNRDGVPRIYRFLAHSDQVASGNEVNAEGVDLIISLDAGSRARLGFDDAVFAGRKLAVIDHHASNARFGDINIVDVSACSTGALVCGLIRHLQLPLSADAASAIYVTLLTDTSGFRNTGNSPAPFELAAELVRAGAESWPIARAVYESRSRASFDLQVLCMQTLEIRHQGRSAWLHVDEQMFRDTGSDTEDTEGLIDLARALDGIQVAVLMRPDDDGDRWKVTFRSKYDVDVSGIAASLGGGGHRHAAGCIMHGDFASIREKVDQVVKESLD